MANESFFTRNYRFIGVALVVMSVFVVGYLAIPDIIHKTQPIGAAPTASTPVPSTSSTPPPTSSSTPSTSEPPPASSSTSPSGSTTTSPINTPTTDIPVWSTTTNPGGGSVLGGGGVGGGGDGTGGSVSDPGVIEEAGVNGSIESAKVDASAVAQQQGPTFCAGNLQCIEETLKALCIDCKSKGWPAGEGDPLQIFDIRVTFEPVDSDKSDIVATWRTNKASSSRVIGFEMATLHRPSNKVTQTANITSLTTQHTVIIPNMPDNQSFLFKLYSQTTDEKADTELLAAQAPRAYDTIWTMVLKAIRTYI